MVNNYLVVIGQLTLIIVMRVHYNDSELHYKLTTP